MFSFLPTTSDYFTIILIIFLFGASIMYLIVGISDVIKGKRTEEKQLTIIEELQSEITIKEAIIKDLKSIRGEKTMENYTIEDLRKSLQQDIKNQERIIGEALNKMEDYKIMLEALNKGKNNGEGAKQ